MGTSSRFEWEKEFAGLTGPQWAAAVTWRAVARVFLPILNRDLSLNPSSALVDRSLEILMSYPIVLDVAYRRVHRLAADSRSIQVADAATRNQGFGQDAGTWGDSHTSFTRAAFSMMARGAHVSMEHALDTMRTVAAGIPGDLSLEWHHEIRTDLELLHSQDAKGRTLSWFLEHPLWNRRVPYGPAWSALDAGTRSNPLVSVLRTHLARPLPRERLLQVLERRFQVFVSRTTGAELLGLAGDRDRLTDLLARLALVNVSSLDLAAAPTAAGFREALRQHDVSREDVPQFEKKLRAQGFTPNGLWRSWIQTVHASALEAIQEEIRAWVTPLPDLPYADEASFSPQHDLGSDQQRTSSMSSAQATVGLAESPLREPRRPNAPVQRGARKGPTST